MKRPSLGLLIGLVLLSLSIGFPIGIRAAPEPPVCSQDAGPAGCINLSLTPATLLADVYIDGTLVASQVNTALLPVAPDAPHGIELQNLVDSTPGYGDIFTYIPPVSTTLTLAAGQVKPLAVQPKVNYLKGYVKLGCEIRGWDALYRVACQPIVDGNPIEALAPGTAVEFPLPVGSHTVHIDLVGADAGLWLPAAQDLSVTAAGGKTVPLPAAFDRKARFDIGTGVAGITGNLFVDGQPVAENVAGQTIHLAPGAHTIEMRNWIDPNANGIYHYVDTRSPVNAAVNQTRTLTLAPVKEYLVGFARLTCKITGREPGHDERCTVQIDDQDVGILEPGQVQTYTLALGAHTAKVQVIGEHANQWIPAAQTLAINAVAGRISPLSADFKPGTLGARFVADVTIPDYTPFQKGETFVKTWRLQNTGQVPWPTDTVATFVGGEAMTGETAVPVGPVAPGESKEISVPMTAPDRPGAFRGQWKLKTGERFITGGGMVIDIRVTTPAAPAAPAPAAPAAVAPAPGPNRAKDTSGFELGGHILQGFQAADKMHYSGMNWAKVQVRYPNDASGIIAAAHANGFKIQISALGDANMVLEPGFEATFSNWVAGIAAAGADAIEIWNEPNLPREWATGFINPQAYTNLLCQSYGAIKAQNGGTAVISAAPAPTGYFGGCHPHGCDDIPWLQNLYNAHAANCFDYIGAHHNAGATPPGASTGHPADGGGHHHSWYFLPQTQAYFNIFNGRRKLFYTELGYVSPEGYGPIPDTFWWGGATTVAQQAQWLAEVVNLSQRTGMVRAVIVWNVDAPCYGMCGGVPDPQAGYAIIRPGGACPACESLHTLLGTR